MPYVVDPQDIEEAHGALVGGKAANLAELSRMTGVRVPAFFCVTTDALERVMAHGPAIDAHLDRLSRLEPDDREAIGPLSAEIRQVIEGIAVPDDVVAAITGRL